MSPFIIFLLAAGLFLTIFGGKLLFEAGFVEKLRGGPWKPDKGFFSSRDGYFTDKYVRGFRYLITGLILLASALYSIFN